jgi:hypothetical protein
MLPEDLGSDGLVVAQISSVTWPEIAYSNPLISYQVEEFAETDDHLVSQSKSEKPINFTQNHIGGVRANTLIVPLAPGEYTLEGLKRQESGTYNSVIYVTYPLNIKFKIESGRATNLGLIQLENDAQNGGRSFRTMLLDNTIELTTYLEERHHNMFNSLESKEFIKGFEQTMSPEELSNLRGFIAEEKFASMQWQYDHPNDSIVTASAGTIARFSKDSKGKIYLHRLYNPHSVADLSNCGVSGTRAVCIVSNETILLLNNDAIKWYTLPAAAPINTVSAFGQSGILLIDDSRRLHISYDNGESWSQYDGVLRDEPIKRNDYKPIDMNSFGIYLGENGYYVFEKNSNGPLVYADYEKRQHQLIDLPDSVNNITQIEERAGRLFIGPEKTEILHDELHYMSLSSKQWSVIEVPTHYCSKMAIIDDEATHIEIYCGKRDVRVTKDQGASWYKQRPVDTFFRDYPF